MSSAFGTLVFVALAIILPCVDGGFWSWARNWSEEEPSNCPSQNNVTHVCSSIESADGTCYTIKCCDDFADDESNEPLDGESSEDSYHDGYYRGCRLCFSSRACALYKCYKYCCEGYERDIWGRCSSETGDIQCENGGVLRYTWWGNQYCKCPSGFRGHNCEIPVCRCRNGGECIIKDGKPYCKCSDGYYGDRCENSNCTLKCYNGGWCYKYGSNEFCWCPSRFIGNQCQQHYTNPDTCPLPEDEDGTCQCQCSRNSDCDDDEVCCKEGCSSLCRKKKKDFCEYDGKTFPINSTYNPDPCKNCTCDVNAKMTCFTVSCAIPHCLYGEPETLPGNCCPSCPDKPDPPKINNCPTSVLRINVPSDSDTVVLKNKITNMNAYDSDGNKLKVKYRPRKAYHCHCSIPNPVSIQATAEDNQGATVTCSFNITVKDPHPPRFYNCPKDISVKEKHAVWWTRPSYEDNVGIKSVIEPDRSSGEIFPVGTHNMTYQVWDHDGNTASCNFSVVVIRDPPKLYNCPTDVIHLKTSSYSSYAILKETTTGIQAYDSDGNKVQVLYQPQTQEHCKCSDSKNQEYKVTATAIDDYGNLARCYFKVTVKDIYPPKVTYCPDNITSLDTEIVTWKEPQLTDNVGIVKTLVNMDKGKVYSVGHYTVTYIFEDFDSNEAACNFDIIVTKAKPEPPKINNCPVHIVQLNTSYLTDSATVDDRSTGITGHDAAGSKLQVKYTPEKVQHCKCSSYVSVSTTIYAEVVDSSGNKDTCQFKVTVKDIYKPIFKSCPSHIYASENMQVSWQEPTYYDNVGVMDSTRSGFESGQKLPVGNHTVHYKIWDYQYNTAICKFNITVTKDPSKPPKMVNCPIQVLNLNTAYNSDKAEINDEVTAIKAYDDAGKELKVNYEPSVIRHCYCHDTLTTETTVVAWAVDGDGVKETCEFNVTVLDKQAPVISGCLGDIEVNEGETLEWRKPTFGDNVAVAGMDTNYLNSAIFSLGRHTVYYDIWDYDFNNASCSFTVSVIKRKIPKINYCPYYGLYLNVPSNGYSVELSESTTSIEAYDGDGKKLQVTYTPRSVRHCFCSNSASNYTHIDAAAIDSAGVSVNCPFKVFVLDEVKPVFTYCPGSFSVLENTIVTWREPEYHDNVDVANKSVSGWKRNTTIPLGKHQITYEIWDYDGNFATCHFNINVIQAECTMDCYNGGRCYRNAGNQYCRCPPDYIGNQCEHIYTHPLTCPAPEPSNGTCIVGCTRNEECTGYSVCCREGCSTVCRQARSISCKFEEQQFRVNQTYSPEPCINCTCLASGTMQCESAMCAIPRCNDGRQPVSTLDQCCLVCPEEPKPRIYCPTHIVHLNTSYYTNMTMLDDSKTSVVAYNHFGVNLQVSYRPPFVHHCKCQNPLNHVTTVQAYAADHYGNVASCTFQVVVRDIYAPVVFSCPEDVYVFEDETVKWLEPDAADNVGITSKSCTSLKNGTLFPLGDYRLTCDIHDFDNNTASCNFRVSVTKRDTPFENMPVGLRERSHGEPKIKLHLILPPIFGVIVLAVLALLLLFLCRRRKCLPSPFKTKPPKQESPKHPKSENIYAEPDDVRSTKSSHKSKRPSISSYSSSVPSRSSAGRALAFHSNAYTVPGDIGIRPPPYSPYVGFNPPPYSVSGSVKDVAYLPMPLPAYHNPDYETLSVHMSSVSGRSTRSGSTASSRSSKAGSTKSSRSRKSGSMKSSK